MDPKILKNIQQQSKRLIDQLKELEELKNELDQAEYEEMKKDTMEQLQTFQKKLGEIQQGDLSLKSEIQKQQEAIREAVKQSFNADEIKRLMSGTQSQGIRESIKKINQDYSLNRIDKNTYIGEYLKCINSLQDIGTKLTQEEKEFQSQYTGKQNFVQQESDVQGQKVLQNAEMQVSDLMQKK